MTTFLEAEIRSQPETVEALLRLELPRIAEIAAQLPPFDYVLVAARGSSDHAALYAKYVWGTLAGYPVALAAPSLYTLYDAPPRLANALVVGISQSGQSPDIAAVVAAARQQRRPTIAITNDVASPLGQVAEHVVDLHAGAERSVAATKTYTAQLAVIAAFAATWSSQADRLAELRAVPEAMRATLSSGADIARSAERYRYVETLVVVGRGYNYATAFELALKLKELTYVMAEPYSSADFRHGPIATVHAGSPVLLVAPSGRASADLLDLAAELRRRDAELLVISDDAELLAVARTPLPLPFVMPEWLTPMTAVLPGQQLALTLALAKDLNPDEPRGLTKVTRTR
jgi:glucosamine--fructose-6-phosphate aminotransferase (isomerizing)